MVMDGFAFEFKNHIDFETSRRPYGVLLEKSGCPSEVLDFTKEFINVVVDQIKQTSEDDTVERTYTEKDFPSNIPFVEEYSITIETAIGDDSEDGVAENSNTKLYVRDGRLFIKPVISVSVSARSRIAIKNKVFSTIGHEMTHFYSYYKKLDNKISMSDREWMEKTGSTDISVTDMFFRTKDREYNDYYKNNLFLSGDGTVFGYEKMFSTIYYITSYSERKAQISELRHDLETIAGTVRGSESATRAITGTFAYENYYEGLNNMVDIIVSYLADEGNSDFKKRLLVLSFNNVFKKKYKDKEHVAVFLHRLRNEYNKYFMTRAVKIAQDILDQNMAKNGNVSVRKMKSFSDTVKELDEIGNKPAE